MPHPKAIVFDLGKVLVDFDYGIAVRRISSHCRIGETEMRRLIDQSPLLLRYETGELTTEQFFAEVQAASGFQRDLPAFGELFADIFTPIASMVELNTFFRGCGLPTYVFSNTNELAVNHIRRRFPFFREFTDHILSFEHGALKPDAKIYAVVENRTGRRGADLLYLDDRPENIAAGALRDWQTILHESPEKTRANLKGLGLVR